jgi:hypothetical protein
VPASPRSDFSKGVDAAANIIAEAAQEHWCKYIDSPLGNPTIGAMNVAKLLDNLTQQLRDHATEYGANPPAPQPETGLDMGARLDGASEFFPQHRKTK